MSWLLLDLRAALRGLRRNPALSLVAILSLALALAGNTTVYGLVHALLYRPMPYPQVEELVFFGERAQGDAGAGGLTATVLPANYLDLAERQRCFAATAAFWGAALSLDAGGEGPEPLIGGTVTPGFFGLFGARFAAGRGFSAEEGLAGGRRAAVLSHRFFATRLGGGEAGAALGQVLRIGGESYEVVGVLDPSFELFAAPQIEVWLPMILDPATAPRTGRGIFGIGRLRPGVTLESARGELAAVMEALAAEHPEANRGRVIELTSLRRDLPDRRNRTLLALAQGALLLVLLIACANLTQLLLARAAARHPESALRQALGARRRHLAGQPLLEALLLALIAGVAGTGLGALAIRAVGRRVAPLLPSFWQPGLDLGVVLYTLGLTLGAGLLVGLAPALLSGRRRRAQAAAGPSPGSRALGSRGLGSRGGGSRALGPRGLVVVQIALAAILLTATGMTLRAFERLQSADPGFDPRGLLMMNVQLPEARFATPEARATAVDAILERLDALPGVAAAGVANVPPRGPVVPAAALTLEGEAPGDGAAPTVDWLAAHPSFFDVLGVPPLRGRLFDTGDGSEGRRVAVVNQAFVRRFSSDREPLGRRITLQGSEREIVGVVADLRHDLGAEDAARPTVYLPWAQENAQLFRLLVRAGPSRASADALPSPASLAEPARREILAVDRAAAVTGTTTLEAFTARFTTGHRIYGVIFGVFGALALALAGLGVYGVLAYAVSRRRHEIGVRRALGATRTRVIRQILREGLVLGLLGLVLALPGALLTTRLMTRALGPGVALDPPSILAAVALLAAVLAAAAYFPARRAATIPPAEALRPYSG